MLKCFLSLLKGATTSGLEKMRILALYSDIIEFKLFLKIRGNLLQNMVYLIVRRRNHA